MSDVQQSTATAETPVVDSTTTQQPEVKTEETPKAEETTTDAPTAEASKPTETETVTETKDEAAPTEEKKETAAAPEKKPVEPITEGQLALKGPGLLKSIIPSKKEFWLSDDAVSPQNLNSYMRGEKPEIAHAVVAWASQSGKGLLFFNKKGDTQKKSPSHVLALYDATELKKESPHEISFKLNGQEHVLKATSDNERDGWYMSIEKAVELGKSHKEEIRESEGYKTEMEKLNKPSVAANAAVASSAKQRSQSQPQKSADADKTETQRKNSDLEDDDKKDKKSRSTSRGVLDRLKAKKDEKKEEKEEKKEEKKDSAEKPTTEESKTEETAGATAGVAGVAAGAAAVGAASSEDKEEKKKDETIEPAAETKAEEKPKPAKRGSIFGKMQGWGSMKSPSKEKEQKDAELKPEVPPKDNVVVASEAPQLPETTTTEPAEESAKAEPEAKPETTDKKEEAATPSKEKSNFLSGLGFGNKRNRSVSPSANMKEAPAKTSETAPAEVPQEAAPVEEGKTDEAIAETTAVEPLKAEEPAKGDTSKTESTPSKRQSVLGNLGRRASKAFKGMQAPKKENAAPTTEAKKEEAPEAPKAVEEPTTNGENKTTESQPQQIGDVVPDAINIGEPKNQPAAVAASA